MTGRSIDLETGIAPISEWGHGCARGLPTFTGNYQASAAVSGGANMMGRKRQGEALSSGVSLRIGSRRKRKDGDTSWHQCFKCGRPFETEVKGRVFLRLCSRKCGGSRDYVTGGK